MRQSGTNSPTKSAVLTGVEFSHWLIRASSLHSSHRDAELTTFFALVLSLEAVLLLICCESVWSASLQVVLRNLLCFLSEFLTCQSLLRHSNKFFWRHHSSHDLNTETWVRNSEAVLKATPFLLHFTDVCIWVNQRFC